MSDDLEARIREGLRDAQLPRSPHGLQDYVAALRDQPLPTRRHRGTRSWILLVPVAAALVGAIAFATGSRTSPAPSPAPSAIATVAASPQSNPSASPATTVDGLAVQSVSELLAARGQGIAPGGPYALHGYWTARSMMHSCAAPNHQTGDLEFYCTDGEWGITELDEEIQHLDIQHQANETSVRATPPAGPHLTPWVPHEADAKRLFGLPAVNGQFWPPVAIVVVGHFDDPKASECGAEERRLCLDRFVIDRIVSFEPDTVPSPAPSPSPTPFPLADPPPALFTDDRCYDGVPKSFTGWKLFNDLDIQVDGPGYVYAMVTRDVIPIGDWFDSSAFPGHKGRWWARGVCYATNEGSTGFGSVTGTGFLELDDGRHIAGEGP